MKLKKFTAPTTREALQKLRAELGEDAIILSTKQTAAGTEVLAASSQDLDTVTEKPAAQSAPLSWTKAERTQFAAQEATREPTPAEKIAQQVAAQRDVLINRSPAVNHQIPNTMPAPDMISDVAKRRSQAASDAMANEQTAVLEEIKQMRQLLKDQMAMITWRDALEKNPPARRVVESAHPIRILPPVCTHRG